MKKFLTIAFALFLNLCIFQVQSTSAWFSPYKEPSIKNNYCGPVMNFKYCKCAFHGQYCDDIGMDSASANNYVQSGFSEWKVEYKKGIAEFCTNEGGIWKGSGCEYCDDGEFIWDGNCQTIDEICNLPEDRNVSLINFDKESGKCFCIPGYEMTSDRYCEPICPPDDPSLTYSAEKDACVCAVGYEENTNGECIEMPEIELWFTFEGTKPPLLADGISETMIDVEIFDVETGDGVDARFDIGYTDAGQKGTLEVVDNPEAGHYKLKYKTTDLREAELSGTLYEDSVFIFYYSKKEEKEIYKVKNIPIAIGVKAKAKITKPGYEEIITDLVFTSDYLTVNATNAHEGATYPVAGAKIELENYSSFEADSNGVILVEAPKRMDSKLESTMDLELKLTAEAKDDQIDAQRNINKIKELTQKDLPATEDFVQNFIKNLAATENSDEAEKILSGIKRVKYSLFYISEASKTLELSTKGMADTIKDQIWDLVDMADLVGKSMDFLASPLKKYLKDGAEIASEITGAVLDPALSKIEGWGGDIASHLRFEGKAFEENFGLLSKKLGEMGNNFFKSLAKTIQAGVAKNAPNFQKGWFGDFADSMFNKYVQDVKLKKKHEKSKYEDYIKNFFAEEYRKTLYSWAELVEKKVQLNNWDRIHTDSDLLLAKWENDELMSEYNLTANFDVRMTEHKANIELALDVVLTPAKFAGATAAAAVAVDNAYKAFRSGVMNNHVFYNWVDLTGKVMIKGQQAVLNTLGTHSVALAPIFPRAKADKAQTFSENERIAISEYTLATASSSFYGDLLSTLKVIEETFPDEDGSLKAYLGTLEEEVKTAEEAKATYAEQAEPLLAEIEKQEEVEPTECAGKNDVNCDGQVNIKDITLVEGVFLGGLILILYFIARLLRKMFGGKKKKK